MVLPLSAMMFLGCVDTHKYEMMMTTRLKVFHIDRYFPLKQRPRWDPIPLEWHKWTAKVIIQVGSIEMKRRVDIHIILFLDEAIFTKWMIQA